MIKQLIASYQFAKTIQANYVAYQFTTDNNITYTVFITKLSKGLFKGLAFAKNAVELILEPAPGSIIPPGTDPRIAASLAVILADYLDTNPKDVFVYACSQEDGQEDARAKKFIQMFNLGNTQGKYKQATFGKDRYKGGFIYEANQPAHADIVKEATRLSS